MVTGIDINGVIWRMIENTIRRRRNEIDIELLADETRQWHQ